MYSEIGSIAGIDEAGRGSVLGPLVIAGVCIKESKLQQLIDIGVKDSKLLSCNKGSKIYQKIIAVLDTISLIKLPPEQIDEYVLNRERYKKLNHLETIYMAKIVEQLSAEIVYIDAPDVNVERFKNNILKSLQKRVEIISTHHADRIYPIVSAASIVAKVKRDECIFELAKNFGSIGSGYPSDFRTINFLEKCLQDHMEFPSFVRKSWKTVKRLIKSYNDKI